MQRVIRVKWGRCVDQLRRSWDGPSSRRAQLGVPRIRSPNARGEVRNHPKCDVNPLKTEGHPPRKEGTPMPPVADGGAVCPSPQGGDSRVQVPATPLPSLAPLSPHDPAHLRPAHVAQVCGVGGPDTRRPALQPARSTDATPGPPTRALLPPATRPRCDHHCRCRNWPRHFLLALRLLEGDRSRPPRGGGGHFQAR